MKVKDLFDDYKPLWIALGGLLLIGTMSLWMSDNTGTIPGLEENSSTVDNDTTVSDTSDCAYDSVPVMGLEDGTDYRAEIVTNLGIIELDLYEDETPITVNSFVFLAKEGFYKGITFHRVIQNFVIQAGDPEVCNSGPGYQFVNEVGVGGLQFKPYVLAMANAGPDTNGSQFFITTHDFDNEGLDGNYTIFGDVLDGFTVVDKIASVQTSSSDRPLTDIVIENIVIKEL